MAKLETVDQITEAIDKVREAETPLYDRMEADYGLFRGEKFRVKSGYEAFTDNSAQTLAGKVIDTLGKGKLSLNIPVDTQKKPKRRDESNTERFILGCLDAADLRLKRLWMPTLQELIVWYAVVRGWIVINPLIYKKKGKEDTVVEINVWDRRWVRFKRGPNGPKWVAHERIMKGKDVSEEYDWDGPDTDSITVINFFDDEMNCIIIDKEFHKEPTDHDCNGVPVIIRPVGATPLIISDEHEDTIKDVGESVFADDRNLFEVSNILKTAQLNMVRKGQEGIWKAKSLDGKWLPELDPRPTVTQEVAVSVARGEDFERVEPLKMPEDTMPMIGMTDALIQRGGLPSSTFGELGFPLSGLALDTLRYGMGSVIDRRVKAVESAYEDIAWVLLQQFSGGGLKPVDLRVRKENDKTEIVTIAPKQVKQHLFEAKLDIKFPQDEMQKWMMARIAREGKDTPSGPLLPDQKINEDILRIADIDLLEDMKREEWAKNLPHVQLTRVIASLLNRGEEEEAFFVLLELQRIQMQMMQSMGGGMGGANPKGSQPLDRGDRGGANMGGVGPEAMPAEAMGVPPQVIEMQRLAQMGLLGPGG